MTTRIITTLFLAVFCATPVPLLASDGFSGFGVQHRSCGSYLGEISTSSVVEIQLEWWVTGFVSGTNLEKAMIVSTDNPGHVAWIKAYCEAHPLEPFTKAAIELNKELDKHRSNPCISLPQNSSKESWRRSTGKIGMAA